MRDRYFIVCLKGDNVPVLYFDGRCNTFRHDSNNLYRFYDVDDSNGVEYLLGAIPLENILYIKQIFEDK